MYSVSVKNIKPKISVAGRTAFITTVKAHYDAKGRHDLPWRHTTDPYNIMVSELMLQQTQVLRVIEKYYAFLKEFPTIRALAQSPQSRVLELWSGLGYNRRAVFLHRAAKECVESYEGIVPETLHGLESLPGIGPYTARAILAFAYNKAVALIETNIKTVYVHHFFKERDIVSDAEILEVVHDTLDTIDPRTWYWALMDYGSYLKSIGIKSHRKSASYAKQSAYVGSNRRVRGLVTKALVAQKSLTLVQLSHDTLCNDDELQKALTSLIKENVVVWRDDYYTLA